MKQTQNFWIILVVILLGLFVFLPLFRPWNVSNYPGYTMMSMMSGGMFFGMGLPWILVIVFLVLGILWFSQQLFQQQRRR